MRNKRKPLPKQPVTVKDWLKHIAIVDSRIYRIKGMRDITDNLEMQVDTYRYNVRKVAFFVLHNRWPAKGFLLPWE